MESDHQFRSRHAGEKELRVIMRCWQAKPLRRHNAALSEPQARMERMFFECPKSLVSNLLWFYRMTEFEQTKLSGGYLIKRSAVPLTMLLVVFRNGRARVDASPIAGMDGTGIFRQLRAAPLQAGSNHV